jgi:4-hydroxybenzoate polyprenyltransferase
MKKFLILGRFHRPIGIWLAFFPALWGLTLSTTLHGLSWRTVFLFLLGTILVRSASCTLNDLIDVPFDQQVRRTQNRPLVTGDITPWQAIAFFAGQMLLAFWVLIQFNRETILLGLGAVALIALYPWMKRITFWPQVFLGVKMNWGFLMGLSSENASLNPSLTALWAGLMIWTIAYDTIYAYQDYEDDQKAGVKSSARALGQKGSFFIKSALTISLILWLIGGWGLGLGWIYGLSVVGVGGLFAWQMKGFNPQDPQSCQDLFVQHQWVVPLLIGGTLLDRAL